MLAHLISARLQNFRGSITPAVLLVAALFSGSLAWAAGPSITLDNGAIHFDSELDISEIRLNLDRGGSVVLSQPKRLDEMTPQGKKITFKFEADAIEADLEIQEMANRLVAFVRYQGPALVATDSVQVFASFPHFSRGLALHKLNSYWTTPITVSNVRDVFKSTFLLLWQGRSSDRYLLLAPLAGGSMTSELGVDFIEFRNRFRISASSGTPHFTPSRFPLFAFGEDSNPFQLVRSTFEAGITASQGKDFARTSKPFPEAFRYLSWCSWNAYEKGVSETKILENAKSFREQHLPVRTMLIDDGWLTENRDFLRDFEANPEKFPGGLKGIAGRLRQEYKMAHVGVWHALQGYWKGIDPTSRLGKEYRLFQSMNGRCLANPSSARQFYSDWYQTLANSGIDFVKIDGQGNTPLFNDECTPLMDASAYLQRAVQDAAVSKFGSGSSLRPTANIINCMGMTLENAFNWKESAVARNSNDYLPNDTINTKEHVFQNSYNALWTSNFTYPDWDMFQSNDEHGEYHAMARAMSGGPIFFTDHPHEEKAEILRALSFSDGIVPRLDEPGMIAREMVFRNPSLENIPLKIQGTLTRGPMKFGVLGVFNVSKGSSRVTGMIRSSDVEVPFSGPVAVLERSTRKIHRLGPQQHSEIVVSLSEFGAEIYTFAEIRNGFVPFGLVNLYLPAAAIESMTRKTVILREAGDFLAYSSTRPQQIQVNVRLLGKDEFTWKAGALFIPRSSFKSPNTRQIVRID